MWRSAENPAPRWSWWFAFVREMPPRGIAQTLVEVPMWALLLPVGAATLWFWRVDRGRRPGACAQCGYDLTGNTTGVL
jgi:hypothetical protein